MPQYDDPTVRIQDPTLAEDILRKVTKEFHSLTSFMLLKEKFKKKKKSGGHNAPHTG